MYGIVTLIESTSQTTVRKPQTSLSRSKLLQPFIHSYGCLLMAPRDELPLMLSMNHIVYSAPICCPSVREPRCTALITGYLQR